MSRFAVLLALGVCAPILAQAGTLQGSPLDYPDGVRPRDTITIPLDGTWIVLDELMTVGSYFSPIFIYTSPDPLQLDVTDLFVVSDRLEVYLDGGLLGVTPLVPDWTGLFPAVGPEDDAPYTDDPNTAWARPEFSKQSFALPAGTHVLTLRDIYIPPTSDGPDYEDGTAAFRVVPEPASGALLLMLGAIGLRRRRRSSALVAAGVVAAALAVGSAQAGTPCGPLMADVVSNTLEIDGTTGADSIRIALDPSNSAIVDVFSPATAGTPSCSYDSTGGVFDTIHVNLDAGDDLIVVDDSEGIVSDGWYLIIDGGDGNDVVLGGIDLDTTPLATALSMLNTLNQARDALDDVLALLNQPVGSCDTVPCLVTNAANVIKAGGEDLIVPTARYIRDIQSELIVPTADAVEDAHDRIANYVQTVLADEAQDVSAEAQMFAADVEVMVDDFDLLLPVAQSLLGRAETLYAHASKMGLSTQNGDSVAVFRQTVDSHVTSIEDLADLCPEDPEPTETQFDEDFQEPNGLPPLCAEIERRVEALEAITDSVEADTDAVEAEANSVQADGDALEAMGLAIGDDELPTSHATQMVLDGNALIVTGDSFVTSAEALNADWEQWVGQLETDLGARGDTMHTRGNTEILAAADTLEAQAQADIETSAAALLAEAQQIEADIEALIVIAAPLLRDDLAVRGTATGCTVDASHTINGGGGSDFLVGTTGGDVIHGGDGADLIIGAGSADELHGDAGNDLIFGGGGGDEIFGGEDVDLLIGNAGDDCIFGGGGQTLTAGSLSVELGDVFFGLDGADRLIAGDDEDTDSNGIDVAFGGKGDDHIRVSHGGDLTIGSFTLKIGNLVFGGEGDDDIVSRNGIDVLFGGPDDDTMTSGRGADLVIGSGSSAFHLLLGDLLFGGDGEDTMNTDDPDANRPNDDIDVAFGGDGNDTIHGFGGGSLVIGDPNDPTFEFLFGNLIFGGNGKDGIDTLDGIDVIFGGANDDTIETAKGFVLTLGDPNGGFRLALGDLIFGRGGNDEIDSDDADGNRPDDDIDVIFGGDGDDTIRAYGGGLLTIGDPNDPDFEARIGNVVFGGDGDDDITTLDGIDLIFCGNGDDTAAGGQGYNLNFDDVFLIDLGDLMFGQDGNDTLHGDAADVPDDEADDGIDLIFCGQGNDAGYGCTAGQIELPDQNFCLRFGNLIFGGPGDDTLRGDYENWDANDPRDGIDLIFGAAGDDTIEGAEGSLIVVGDLTSGQAVIIGFGNLLFGGPDDDTIRGANAGSLCSGVSSDLDDLLNDLGITDLNGAADLIFCGSGNDDVDAYNGIDFVFGSDGEDNLRADNGGFIIVPISGVPTPIAMGNLMFGGDDDDMIRSLGRIGLPTIPPIELDLLFGNKCDDTISAGDGLNIVFGNRNDDTITTGDGINIVFGNRGDDTINMGTGLNIGFGNRDNDVVAAQDGINVLFGNRGDDDVSGGLGLNVTFGNRGVDSVSGGLGLNVLFGNRGIDNVTSGGGLTVAFGNKSNDIVQAGPGISVLFGNAGDDQVSGGPLLNVSFGNSGNDIMSAGAGLAVLFGNSGEDRLTTSAGLSVVFGNKDKDILRSGGPSLYVAFGNNGNDVIVGGGGLNLIFGNRGADQVFGGGGVNIEFGNSDDDILRGGGSADFIFGNRGSDQIAGNGATDFLFGNRGNDSIVGDGAKDFIFGNRGDDTLRSGNDGGTKDYIFGNRGNDNLHGCDNSDKLYGGRGSDSKNRDDCNDLTLSPPACGEVRGFVRIDTDGDGIGDVGQPGVTVMAGSGSAVTDDDGAYRIGGLAVGSHTVSQSVPGGYSQISPGSNYSVTVGSMGIDLFLNRDFVNREDCFVSPDAWSCLGNACGGNLQCMPVLVRKVLRCPQTGEICQTADDCCGDCEPSWAVEECDCVNPDTDCYIILTSAGPQCSMQCVTNDGTLAPCDLVVDGDLCWCACSAPEPCPTELAQFTFSGHVTAVTGDIPPPPWNTVTPGDTMNITYWFARFQPDQDPTPPLGDYPAIVFYQLSVGSAADGGAIASPLTLIRNVNGQMISSDEYRVSIPLSSPPGSMIDFFMRLMDTTGTAWTLAGLSPRDALPLCGDVVLDRFARRTFTISETSATGAWQITGLVDIHECDNCAGPFPSMPSPEPSVNRGGKLSAPATDATTPTQAGRLRDHRP
ncbi:MAG: PEP-CTERM sorting domain-containing protein [Phycisphaerales bacterium]|nr:PEP-CTERM sorting domain-containing protein [Phycisphaerales bacterium]